jgi:hypothetical protein
MCASANRGHDHVAAEGARPRHSPRNFLGPVLSNAERRNAVLTKERCLEHLGYEWWMFRSMSALLQTIAESDAWLRDPVRNAMVESLVVHGRGLVEFFFRPPVTPGARARGNEDARCDVLGVPPATASNFVDEWHDEASKRVVHFTHRRHAPLASWDTPRLLQELQPKMDEVRRSVGDALFNQHVSGAPESGLVSAALAHLGATAISVRPYAPTVATATYYPAGAFVNVPLDRKSGA